MPPCSPTLAARQPPEFRRTGGNQAGSTHRGGGGGGAAGGGALALQEGDLLGGQLGGVDRHGVGTHLQ
jgi:hypothetical protein